jgi:hypothetical protein
VFWDAEVAQSSGKTLSQPAAVGCAPSRLDECHVAMTGRRHSEGRDATEGNGRRRLVLTWCYPDSVLAKVTSI